MRDRAVGWSLRLASSARPVGDSQLACEGQNAEALKRDDDSPGPPRCVREGCRASRDKKAVPEPGTVTQKPLELLLSSLTVWQLGAVKSGEIKIYLHLTCTTVTILLPQAVQRLQPTNPPHSRPALHLSPLHRQPRRLWLPLNTPNARSSWLKSWKWKRSHGSNASNASTSLRTKTAA